MAGEKLEPWSDLVGKVVMVTGASSGLGLEFCLDLAKTGCSIVAAARRVDKINSLCQQINAVYHVQAAAVELDVTANSSTIEASVERAWNAFGRIDALVNNAGIRGSVHTPLKLSEEEWNQVYNTNAKGTWLVTKYVCKRMREGGSVINISSLEGLQRGHAPGCMAYASSKAAVNTMTKVMAIDLGAYNIRVNCISPGIFKSQITEALFEKEWMIKKVAYKTVPLRTTGTSDPALTSLLRYLIHDSSKYVTGNNFIVEAGFTSVHSIIANHSSSTSNCNPLSHRRNCTSVLSIIAIQSRSFDIEEVRDFAPF